MGIYNSVADPVLLRQNEQLRAELAQIKEAIGLEVSTDEDGTTTYTAKEITKLTTELTAVAEAVNLEIVEDGSIKQIVKEPVQLL